MVNTMITQMAPAINGIQVIYDPDLAPLTAYDVVMQALQCEFDKTPMTAADAEARDKAFWERNRKKTAQEKMEDFLRTTIMAETPRKNKHEEESLSLRNWFFATPHRDDDPPTEREFSDWMAFMSGRG